MHTNLYKIFHKLPGKNHLNCTKKHSFSMSDSLKKVIPLQGLFKLSDLISVKK